MRNNLAFRAASLLYNTVPVLYKPLYYSFKKKQDAFEINLMKKFISQGNNVLDIGANIGFYAELFNSLVGASGSVHCFEPDPENYKRLLKNTKQFSSVCTNSKAVSEHKGNITFYKSHRLNVDHRTYEPQKYHSSFEVEMVSVDEYINDKFSVDFIKIDIQGAEYPALLGMKKTLSNTNITLLSEFWPYGLQRAGSSKEEVFTFLKNLDFKIFIIESKGLKEIKLENDLLNYPEEEETYYNILATRKSI